VITGGYLYVLAVTTGNMPKEGLSGSSGTFSNQGGANLPNDIYLAKVNLGEPAQQTLSSLDSCISMHDMHVTLQRSSLLYAFCHCCACVLLLPPVHCCCLPHLLLYSTCARTAGVLMLLIITVIVMLPNEWLPVTAACAAVEAAGARYDAFTSSAASCLRTATHAFVTAAAFLPR